MLGLGEFAFSVVMSLIMNVINRSTDQLSLSYFQRKKIQRRVEDATAEVVEPLLPFLSQEHLTEDQQRLIIQTCIDELRPISEDPAPLFEGSLDGQKIFDNFYTDRELPQAILDEDMGNIYALLFPRIATLLCKIPVAVKDWESQAWTENFRRLDQLAAELRELFQRLDSMKDAKAQESRGTLTIARKALAQKLGFRLDLTGLRADKPLDARLDDLFVHPQLTATIGKKKVTVNTPSDCFAHFFRRRARGIVSGAPGAGKSTWSRWLQRELLTDQWDGLPIRVELRQLSTKELPTLHELIRSNVSTHLAEDVTTKLVGEWIGREQVAFILDGFDEIAPAVRDVVVEWILELRMAIKGCTLIVTTRPLTTSHLSSFPQEWVQWQMEPFDQPRVVDYIHRWYQHAPLLVEGDRSVDAEGVARQWQGDPTIAPLTGNPLLLSTLLMVHHLDGALPSGRAQLYKRYVDGMLGLWDDRRRVKADETSLTLEQKRQVLRKFAIHLQLSDKDQIEETETTQIVEGILRELGIKDSVENVLATLRERSGLIVGPGVYSFIHKSVSEFLVAEAIVQGDQRDPSGKRIDRLRLFQNRGNDKWNVVTFLWAGLAPISDVESFVEDSIKAGNLALGYGVLMDQYDRFSVETRREQLLHLRGEVDQDLFDTDTNSWLLDYPSDNPRMERLMIPVLGLRGLAQYGLDNLFDRGTRDGTIQWSDFRETQGNIRDLLWMSVASIFHDIEDWKECVSAPPPSIGADNDWIRWVARSMMSNHIHGIIPDKGTAQWIKAYIDCFPEFSGYLPLGLFSAALYRYSRQHQQKNAAVAVKDIAERSMTILPLLGDCVIPPNPLRGTRRWNLGAGAGVCDLLSEFLDFLKSEVPTHIKDTDAHKKAVDYVENLIQQRESLS